MAENGRKDSGSGPKIFQIKAFFFFFLLLYVNVLKLWGASVHTDIDCMIWDLHDCIHMICFYEP